MKTMSLSLEKFLVIGAIVSAIGLFYTSVSEAAGMDGGNMQAHIQQAQTSFANMSQTAEVMDRAEAMLEKASAMGQSIERSQAMMDKAGLMGQSMERAQRMMDGASQMGDSMGKSQEMMDNMSQKAHSMDKAQMMQDMEQHSQMNDQTHASLIEHSASNETMNEFSVDLQITE